MFVALSLGGTKTDEDQRRKHQFQALPKIKCARLDGYYRIGHFDPVERLLEIVEERLPFLLCDFQMSVGVRAWTAPCRAAVLPWLRRLAPAPNT
jgi:hypothetical protein